MHEVVESLQAPPDCALKVWVEPWAEEFTFPPGTLVELRAASPSYGQLEIDCQEQFVAVYAWPGSTLRVLVRGELVRDFSIPVPDIPAGMEMKGFVGFLFGEPSKGSKKPWWRFW